MSDIIENAGDFTGYVIDKAPLWGGAIAILIIGWIIAKAVDWAVTKGVNKTGFGKKALAADGNIGKSLGIAFYWVILLAALYMALTRLGFGEYLAPLKEMLDKFLAFAPNLLGAGLIFFIGMVIAKVAKNAVQSVLHAAQFDELANRFGVTKVTGQKGGLSATVGTFVFVLILIPILIAALSALQLTSITEPATQMLYSFMAVLPKLIGATIILAIAFFIGRWISSILQSTLPSLGFDNVLNYLGLLDDGVPPKVAPSVVVGTVALYATLLTGLTAAVSMLDIAALEGVFGTILELGARIVLGSVIIAVGLFLARFISNMVTAASGELAGTIVKAATIIIAIFMGLDQMGIGNEIVDTTYQYVLGGTVIAGALAFGMGGRKWAEERLDEWTANKKKSAKTTVRKAKTVKSPSVKTPTKRKTR